MKGFKCKRLTEEEPLVNILRQPTLPTKVGQFSGHLMESARAISLCEERESQRGCRLNQRRGMRKDVLATCEHLFALGKPTLSPILISWLSLTHKAASGQSPLAASQTPRCCTWRKNETGMSINTSGNNG